MNTHSIRNFFVGAILLIILVGCSNNNLVQQGDFITNGISYLKSSSEKQMPLNTSLIKRYQSTTDSFPFSIPLNKYYLALHSETFIGIPVITAKTAMNLKIPGFNRVLIDSISCLYKCTKSENSGYKFGKQYIFNTDNSCIYILKNDADSLPTSLPIQIPKNAQK